MENESTQHMSTVNNHAEVKRDSQETDDLIKVCREKLERTETPLKKLELPVLRHGFYGTEWILKIKLPRRFAVLILCGAMLVYYIGLFVLFNYEVFVSTPLGTAYNYAWNNFYWSNYSRIDTNCGILGSSCSYMFDNTSWSPARCNRYTIENTASIGNPVIGTGYYHPASFFCAAAVHSGAITNSAGGCFKYRFAGAVQQFVGSTANGFTSSDYGWFPGSFEFASLANGEHCNDVRIGMEVYIICLTGLIILFLRPLRIISYLFIVISGYFMLIAQRYFGNPVVVHTLNNYFTRVLLLVLGCLFLYPVCCRSTIPDPKQFPIDFWVFYFLPFWITVHLNDIELTGLGVSFGSDISQPGNIVGLILIIVVAVPLVILQLRLWYFGAKKLWVWIVLIVAAVVCFIVYLEIYNNWLSLHIHHWIAGVAFMLFFQGQPKLRYSIFAHGLGLGLLVNGIILWNAAPIFDQKTPRGSGGSSPYYVWTSVNITDTYVSMSWALQSNIQALCANISATSSSLLSANLIDLQDLVMEPTSGGLRRALGSSVLPNLTTSPRTVVTMNGLVLYNSFMTPINDTFSIAQDGLTADTYYQFAAGSGSIQTPSYLYVNTSLPNLYYDPSNPLYDDVCQRVLALPNYLDNVTYS